MPKLFDDIYYYQHPIGANCCVFVFKDGKDLDFIDTGISRARIVQNVWQGMLKDGLDPRRIRSIYHTHSHFDHVQADLFFQRKAFAGVDNVPVYVPKNDLHRMNADFSLATSNFQELYQHFPRYPFITMKSQIFQFQHIFEPLMRYKIPSNVQGLENLQKVRLGKHTATVYMTGGHTEGHSFFHIDDAENILVTGDHDALNEYTCNWRHTLEAVRLAEKLNPDNVFIGHNAPKLGHENAMKFINSYFKQYDEIFLPLFKHFYKGRRINLTKIILSKMGVVGKVKLAVFWAQMALFAICKYFEELKLGYMELVAPGELFFTITADPKEMDLLNMIRYGEKRAEKLN